MDNKVRAAVDQHLIHAILENKLRLGRVQLNHGYSPHSASGNPVTPAPERVEVTELLPGDKITDVEVNVDGVPVRVAEAVCEPRHMRAAENFQRNYGLGYDRQYPPTILCEPAEE